jgi:N-acetylglutamate synthase-like GNAT family acetyltransferase
MEIADYDDRYQAEIIELILSIQTNEYGLSISAEDQPDLSNINEFYLKNSGNFWVALDTNRVVGTIALVNIGQGAVALRKMFVHKDYRGKTLSVAKLLLDTSLSWSKANGINSVFLGTTDQFKAAHRFYEKNGFEVILQQALPDTFPIMAVDTRFYKKILTDSVA